MSEFKPFADALARHFTVLSQNELYRVNIEGDQLWEEYLAAFPEGTNPIFRKRTEHDGSYDRNFVRHLGNVVRIDKDGSLSTIWDLKGLEHPYSVVAATLSERVKAGIVATVFRTQERKYGYVETKETLEDGSTIRWNHFNAEIADRHRCASVGEVTGNLQTTVDVFRRGLETITASALATMLDLIDSDNLYRGAESRNSITEFSGFQAKFAALKDEGARQIYLWNNVGSPAARFRNTAIGTLAIDLSEGKDLDASVRAFEKKVAPENYKRPTAVITQGMVKEATKTIQDLGLEPALERRHAKFSDVSVNNVLWTSNTAAAKMKDGIEGLLAGEVTRRPDTKPEDITIEEFLALLPKARSLEILVKNQLSKNFMSVTAPVHASVNPLFKWDNDFAWSYNGNITDAIKERVKAAGGNVKADIRVSLAWFNYDDLDIQAISPYGHIYYANKCGILDVDMNAGTGKTREAVENLAFNRPKDGKYVIEVNQFRQRETDDVGFTLELEYDGSVTQFSYPKAVKGTVTALEFSVKNGTLTSFKTVDSGMTQKGLSQVIWGVQTERFVPVETVMLSPNFWDDKAIGNKHWFFILEDCKNDQPTRGIYNEFLRGDLSKISKVFEVLGNKTKCPVADEQLSGLGFSSTVRETVTIHVTGEKINKTYNVKF